MTENNIPEAAIEAGAKGLLFEDCGDTSLWETVDETEKRVFLDHARAVLTAALPHLHPVVTHETKGDFYDAAHGELLIVRDKSCDVWQAWETDEGEWIATRPRNEDDPKGPLEDPWRPVGPDYVEDLEFPITVTPATILFRGGDAL